MKKYFVKTVMIALLLVGVIIAASAASAQSIVFNGSIQPSDKHTVLMPIGGIVEKVLVKPGDEVKEDTPIARLRTTKIYAEEDGNVTAVFGQPGDDAEVVGARYGGIVYIEGPVKYTIKGNTRTAHRTTETQYVHAGEKVYLISRNHNGYTGAGHVSVVKGNDFTVQVTDGEFLLDETIAVHRDPDMSSSSKIGSGLISRNPPIAVTAKGGIVAMHVKPGDTVKRGDLLLETLDGDFDGLYMTGPEITAEINGTVGEIKLAEGSTAAKGTAAAVIYPKQAAQVQAKVNENDLQYVHIGQKVSITFDWDSDEKESVEGVISGISSVANTGDKVTYTIYIDFEPVTDVKYGMSVSVGIHDEDVDLSEFVTKDNYDPVAEIRNTHIIDVNNNEKDIAKETDEPDKPAEGVKEEESVNE